MTMIVYTILLISPTIARFCLNSSYVLVPMIGFNSPSNPLIIAWYVWLAVKLSTLKKACSNKGCPIQVSNGRQQILDNCIIWTPANTFQLGPSQNNTI